LSISTHVDKWEKDLTQEKLERVKEDPLMKSLVIRFKPTIEQRSILDKNLHTSNYVYNKTLNYIKNKGYNPLKDAFKLRTLLVTNETKTNDPLYKTYRRYIKNIQDIFKKKKDKYIKKYKNKQATLYEYLTYLHKKTIYNRDIKIIEKKLAYAEKYIIEPEKNLLIKPFELKTEKAVREGSVNTACNAYKTAIANVKAGNIKTFNIHYRNKKKYGTAMYYPKSIIKLKNNILYFTSEKMKNKKIMVGPSTQKKNTKIKYRNKS
jgi:hypothetical protein